MGGHKAINSIGTQPQIAQAGSSNSAAMSLSLGLANGGTLNIAEAFSQGPGAHAFAGVGPDGQAFAGAGNGADSAFAGAGPNGTFANGNNAFANGPNGPNGPCGGDEGGFEGHHHHHHHHHHHGFGGGPFGGQQGGGLEQIEQQLISVLMQLTQQQGGQGALAGGSPFGFNQQGLF